MRFKFRRGFLFAVDIRPVNGYNQNCSIWAFYKLGKEVAPLFRFLPTHSTTRNTIPRSLQAQRRRMGSTSWKLTFCCFCTTTRSCALPATSAATAGWPSPTFQRRWSACAAAACWRSCLHRTTAANAFSALPGRPARWRRHWLKSSAARWSRCLTALPQPSSRPCRSISAAWTQIFSAS